ncbi:MAG: hypothetical protein H7Y32_13025 [Chloroflexales bacterium]|nr:hypothetical protein [Chloroflexales bacterium]
MSENDAAQPTPISQARTPQEIGDYWDTHSLEDHWGQTSEANIDVRAKRRKSVALDPAVYASIEAHAQLRGVVPETLVNLWLLERLISDAYADEPSDEDRVALRWGLQQIRRIAEQDEQ